MTNKKFIKWLHRLPVLLIALILAVLPISMAAPAYAADPLDGTGYYEAIGDGLHVIWDQPGNVLFGATVSNGFYSFGMVVSEEPIRFTNIGTSFLVPDSGGRFTVYYFEGREDAGVPVLDFRYAPYDDDAGNLQFDEYFSVGDVVVTGGNVLPIDSLVRHISSIGVLSVFSGVGSWLSGAVQNISSMFWVADSGMTVLGYLAVASLALAVILLIFYLIAGWLKFK